MHVAHLDALLVHVFGQVLGHALGQGGDQGAEPGRRDAAHLVQQIVDLRADRAHLDHRVQKAGGADHLFGKDAACLLDLPFGGGGGDKDRLRAHRVPFLEFQRSVIHAGGQAEAMFGERELAAIVALVHGTDLRDGHVRFIGKDDGIVRNEFKKGRGRLARCAAGQIARIVFDPVAHAGRLQHLQIEIRALFQPLRFQQLAFAHQLIQPDAQLLAYPDDRLLHRGLGRHIVAVGIDADLVECTGLLARQRIKFRDTFKLIAEEAQPPGAVLKVGGKHLQRITAHAKTATLERSIVALVLLRNQIGHDLPLVVISADA